MWEELETLFKDKKTINTLKLESPIKLIKITNDNVVIKTANNKFRIISRKEIEDSYIYLMQKGEISRIEIQRFFSPRNPAYVASILANIEGINHYSKPKIVLYISHEKRKIADKILNFGEINSDAFSSNRIKYKTLKHQYINSFNKRSSNIPKEDESRSDEYDNRGFDKEGIHKITKTKYDEYGYDENWIDKKGFDWKGIHVETKTKYDLEGYDKEGFDINGFNKEGINKLTKTKYDIFGKTKQL